MKRVGQFLLVWLVLVPWTDANAIDTIVVRPAAWAPALSDWQEYRQAQGHTIKALDAELGRDQLLTQIKSLYRQHSDTLRFVVLAADVSASASSGIPTFYRNSSAMVQFGGDARIATDNPYADIDGDDIPELAVARIPADTPEQLADFCRRVMSYEANHDFSTWRRNVHVVAGVGGFGPLTDSVIELTTRRFLADRIPGWSEVSMTQASLSSHYCPDPWRFSEAAIDKMNAGGMFWVYIGHGHVQTLDYIRAKDEFLPILTHEQVPAVACHQPPIAVFLACYTGAFDAVVDSLAEELVMRGQGPIAAIAASRVSGPYGLAMLSDGLLGQFYRSQPPTLGEIVCAAKRQLLVKDDAANGHTAEPAEAAPSQMEMINAIAAAMSPQGYDLRAERLEHVWQMHMLGDPLMRVQFPQDIPLVAPAQAMPGESIVVAGRSMDRGAITLELGYRRDQHRKELDQLQAHLDSLDGREQYQQRYVAANDRVIQRITQVCDVGQFELPLTIPATLPNGRYCVRVFVEGQQGWQVGYTETVVRKPRSKSR